MKLKSTDVAKASRNLGSKALIIDNSLKMGVYGREKIVDRRVFTDGTTAEAMLLLQSLAFHLGAVYSRRHGQYLEQQGITRNQEVRNINVSIRKNITLYTESVMNFIYPDALPQFKADKLPWLITGKMKTMSAVNLMLPLCIYKMASVQLRTKTSFEYDMLQEAIDFCVMVWKDLRIKKFRPPQEGEFHIGELVKFGQMYDGYHVPGTTRPNNTPWVAPKGISRDLAIVLEREAIDLAMAIEQSFESDVTIIRGSIVKHADLLYVSKTDIVIRGGAYQVATEDFQLIQ
jgi:hypothetical protein